MFHFPEPGWHSSPADLVLGQTEVYRLLVASAPVLIIGGESENCEDPLNDMLMTWWELSNALDRDLRIMMQKVVRDQWGDLPASPWEFEEGSVDHENTEGN
jgi:hypothetical protein